MIVAFGQISVIKLYGILLFFAVLLILSGASLINAWIVHRDKELALSDVLTSKNVFTHLAANFIYTLNVADANADSFICSLVAPGAGASEEKKKLPA